MDHVGLAQPRARNHRIARMLVETVFRIHHAANAALRKIGIAVLQTALGNDDNLAIARQVQRAHETSHAGPYHEVIAINDFHNAYSIKILKETGIKPTNPFQN